MDAPAREDASREFEPVDNYASLTPLLAALTPRDRMILGLRFVHGYTQKEIGDRIGVSQMQVSRLLNAVLGPLREQRCAD